MNHFINHPSFDVVFIAKSSNIKFSSEFLDIVNQNRLIVNDINSLEDLIIIKEMPLSTIFIMYKFRYIIPEKLLDQYRFLNVHPGDLRYNRGANPIEWSILLNEKYTMISLHAVDKFIDSGDLLSEYLTIIESNETNITLEKKIEKNIPLIIEDIKEFLIGKLIPSRLPIGDYRRRVNETDYTINQFDNNEVIDRKIRSQAKYGGAIIIINEKKYRVTCF